MMQSELINDLAAALAKAQAAMQPAIKDSKNPYFKSNYADLSSVWAACQEPLTTNGLAVVQMTEEAEDGVVIVTQLIHSSGQWISGRLKMKPVKNDPQGIGSCISYARRYALAALVGVVTEDDDGEAATGRTQGKAEAIPATGKDMSHVGATYVNTPEEQVKYKQDKKDTLDRIKESMVCADLTSEQAKKIAGFGLSTRSSLAELIEAEERINAYRYRKEQDRLTADDIAILMMGNVLNTEEVA